MGVRSLMTVSLTKKRKVLGRSFQFGWLEQLETSGHLAKAHLNIIVVAACISV